MKCGNFCYRCFL